jgi:predicted transcriptional regulator
MRNSRLKDGFGMVSNIVMRDPEISLRDKAIYSYLATYANSSTNSLTVGINKVAADCNIGHSTVKRALESLEEAGVITRSYRGQGNTRLTILIK